MDKFAVIFDSDGVIVDSEKHSLRAFVQAIDENGIHLSDEDILSNCGLTDADIIIYMREKFKLSIDLNKFSERKKELYTELVKSGILEVFPGVKDLLNSLNQDKIPYALASSGSREKIFFNLKKTGLTDYFPIIISGEDFERGKPDPAIFLAAAKKLNTATQRCVVIEDSLNGIKAAKNAGMPCIAVAHTFSADKLTEADLILQEIAEINISKIRSLIK